MLEFLFYSIISLLLLRFLHLFYNYLKNNYTTKKVKCLGKFENEKYLEILNELKNNKQKNVKINNDEDYVSKEDKIRIEDSLFEYVKTVTI